MAAIGDHGQKGIPVQSLSGVDIALWDIAGKITGLPIHKLIGGASGGEAEFARWGWRSILENRGLDIAQPEVCALGGITEYLRVLALCHAHFTPVINHVWGSAVAVATNLQLLAAMPPLPGGLHPWEPMLEFDTTENRFRDDLLVEPLDIQAQVKKSGRVQIPQGPGIGVTPDADIIAHYEIEV